MADPTVLAQATPGIYRADPALSAHLKRASAGQACGIHPIALQTALAEDPAVALTVAGRDRRRGEAFVRSLRYANPVAFKPCDVDVEAAQALAASQPNLVIHTAGPFQGAGYDLAQLCI